MTDKPQVYLSSSFGDRGKLRAHPADRVAHEPSHYVSRPDGEHPLRGALLDYRGLIFFCLIVPAIIWGGLAVAP